MPKSRKQKTEVGKVKIEKFCLKTKQKKMRKVASENWKKYNRKSSRKKNINYERSSNFFLNNKVFSEKPKVENWNVEKCKTKSGKRKKNVSKINLKGTFSLSNRTHNSGFKKLRNFCKIHKFLSQVFLS